MKTNGELRLQTVTCENVNQKNFRRSLQEKRQNICLKNNAEALPLFRLKKQRHCRLSLVTKKTSGATATKKVAAGEERRCAHHCVYSTVPVLHSTLVLRQNVGLY